MQIRIVALVTLMLAAVSGFAADTANDLKRPTWWPSEWGPDDQRGALNRLGPARVLAAARLITSGNVYDMGRVFEEDMPLFNLTPQHRKYTLTTPGAPSWGPLGRNALAWNEDYIAGHLTQDGTQFDALSHMATVDGDPKNLNDIRYYNGHSHAEIGSGRGFSKLGVEHVTPIFTRGVLIDIAGLKGRMIDCDEEVTVKDLQAALQRQGMSAATIQPGDALFYNTGWGRLWKTDNARFLSCTPGLTPAAGDWAIERKVVMVGTDNWAVETIPGPDPDNFAPNHQKFLVENGIYIMENLDFSKLIDAGVYEFAFVFGAIPFKGATGSPGRPFAIR
ncbi:MAG: cyclase family protein [Gammaproteobacteria bacterium]|nr:cyclase family protein [Gammaproteobacteria bacterium]